MSELLKQADASDDLRNRLLLVKPRAFEKDDLVATALSKTKAHFRAKVPAAEKSTLSSDASKGDGKTKAEGRKLQAAGSGAHGNGAAGDAGKPDVTGALLKRIREQGLSTHILKVTTALNKAGMDDVERVLLSTVGIYDYVLLKLLVAGDKAEDTEGLKLAVLTEVNDEPRAFFNEQLVDRFLKAEKLDLDEDLKKAFRKAVARNIVPLAKGQTSPALMRLFDDINVEGNLPQFVRRYANERALIDPVRFTNRVQEVMVDYLERIGMGRVDQGRFEKGEYDEYFAQAYHHALFGSGANAKTQALITVKPSEFDFDLDAFDLAEEQGNVKEHVLAAAALYYMYVLGDLLGIFEMPNALILRRAKGKLFLKRGDAAARLQEHKTYIRTRAMEPADRMLLYGRVFNEGDVEMLPDTVVNEEFPELLHSLMSEVTKYIGKTEANSSERDDKVSRSPIYEAIRNLQYNLSSYAGDVAEDVLDLKDYFDRVQAILSDDDIIRAVVRDRRQDSWSVIETLIKEDLKRPVNLRPLRTLGIEGYKVLQFIADFDLSTPEDEFQKFLRSAEAWIIAQGALGDTLGRGEDEQDEFDDMDVESDEYENGEEKDDDWES